MKRKLLAVLTSVLLLCSMLLLGAVGASAATSGTTGDCTWVLDGTHLTISGNGAMDNYGSWRQPWSTEITTVTIENGVTTIGDNAFSYCTSLTSVTIPDSVTSIGESAFECCDALPSIIIPDSVTSIGAHAIRNCYSLTSVIIPDSVTTIGEYAFYACDSLTSMTIPDSVTTIGDNAFSYCDSLTSVAIGDSVTTIGYETFYHCDALTSVTIGDSVTTIGETAFAECYSLTSVTIPDGVTSIGEYAFAYCESLTSIDVDKNNPNYSSLNGVLFDKNQTTLIQYPSGKSGNYTIPDSVTSIGKYAFDWCASLTSVTISDNLATVHARAFESCYWLTDIYYTGNESDRWNINVGEYNDCFYEAMWHYGSVDEPEDEPEVPAGLLYEITNKKVTITGYTSALPANLVIPATIEGYPVTSIGGSAFSYCTSLTSVTIGDNVISIEMNAFYDCDSLKSVTIGDSVNFIGGQAFCSCDSLKSVTVGDSVTSIGWSAFYYCPSLTSVTIGNSVTTIGEEAFYMCDSLTSVTIPDSVTTIDYAAFRSCDSLKSVTIPESVTTIGDKAFSVCDSLTSIDVDKNNPNYSSLDGVLFDKNQTTLIQYPGGKSGAYTIPDSVTSIGEEAFSNCDSLTSVTIGNSVTTIGRFAFYWCTSLTSVIIPDSVTTIGDYAFYYCISLTAVTIPDSVTTIGKRAFYSCDSLTDVYYGSSEESKANIDIGYGNDDLLNATWHYATDPISDTVTHSVMDTANGNGLAFRFELSANGVAMVNGTTADLSNATISYLGKDCKLIGMGAVLTNDANIANGKLTREQSNGLRVIDIPVVYLQEVTDASCAFATRLINIPDTQLERTIYARPYYIVEVDGEEIVVYGDVDSASCAEYM